MSLPRRSFLKTGIMSALSVGAILSSARLGLSQKSGRVHTTVTTTEIPLAAQRDPVFLFARGTFDPYVGDIFQAPNALGQMVSLTLISVTDYKPQSATKLSTLRPLATECFSLMFKASDQLPPFTSIHKISHPALGKFDLFLTPRESGDGVFFYEAVINHIR
jgi:hypothetical protein